MRYIVKRSKIANHQTQVQVLANWREIDTKNDKAFADRLNRHRKHLQNKEQYWDHNTAIVWACDFFQAQSYLEIGVRNCCSLIHGVLARSVIKIVGIDAWAGKNGMHAGDKSTYEMAIDKLSKWTEIKSIALMREYSHVGLNALLKLNSSFDIACVDGDHSEVGAGNDLAMVFPLVKKCIIMDDLHHSQHGYLKKVFENFCEERNLDYVINDQYPGTGIAFIDGVPFEVAEEPFEYLEDNL